jgi:hypothetical protein
MKKLLLLLILSLGVNLPVLRAEEDPHVKTMMLEALRLYNENQFIQALDMFNQIERIDPSNAIAKEYIPKTEQKIQEWEKEEAAGGEKPPAATWDSLMNKPTRGAPVETTNAKDLIAARRSLVERMKNRAVNTNNIVQISDTKRALEITLYHDQLFLPGLQTLRDEALPVLENVAMLMRQKGDREVILRSLARTDSTDPFLLYPDFPLPASAPGKKGDEPQFVFQDIEATRSFILFTHLAQRAMIQPQTAKQ